MVVKDFLVDVGLPLSIDRLTNAGFEHLKSEDQIALLKGSFVEVMLLRNCCGYNYLKASFNIATVAKDTGAMNNLF